LLQFVKSIVIGEKPDVSKSEVLSSMRIALAINDALISGKIKKVKII